MVDRIEKPVKDTRVKDKDKSRRELIGFPQGRIRGFIDDLLKNE